MDSALEIVLPGNVEITVIKIVHRIARINVTDGVESVMVVLMVNMEQHVNWPVHQIVTLEHVNNILVSCSGGDVEGIIAELFAKDAAGLLDFTRATGRLIQNIVELRRPVIAAVNGVAVDVARA